jgi:hypothetical protein
MAKNKFKQHFMAMPIENHETAAWANMEHLKRGSRVPQPAEVEVKNAKEWVDTNQK